MLRSIKFRAQRSDNKEFVYGFYYKGKRADQNAIDTPLGFARLFSSIITEEGVIYDVLEKTVGQFTGFLDINSKEIWEGDIVRKTWQETNANGFSNFEVKWQHQHCGFGITLGKNHKYEMVGNIHENPDLLK